MENQNVSLVNLEKNYVLNGTELTTLEWNTFLRLAVKCGLPVVTGKAEKVGKAKGKPANLYTFDNDFSFTVGKKD